MNKNQHGFGGIILPLLLVGIFLLIGAAYYFVQSAGTKVRITNDGAAFSLDLGVPAVAKTVNSDGNSREVYEATLSDAKLVATIYVPTKTVATKDADCGVHPSFKSTILGSEHTVCNQKEAFYVANFDSAGTWYQITVFPDDLKTPFDQATITKLLASIQAE